MAILERTYTIPLRKQVMKAPMYKRAKKAVRTVQEFISKHMKSDDVKVGQMINRELWKRGIKNPPMKLRITAIKDDKGTVRAELFGHKYVEIKKVEKVEKSKLEQLKEKMLGKEATKKEHNKEAIEHIHDAEHPHDHTAHEKSDMGAILEKDRRTTSGKEKAKNKERQ